MDSHKQGHKKKLEKHLQSIRMKSFYVRMVNKWNEDTVNLSTGLSFKTVYDRYMGGTYKHRIGPDRAQLPDRTGSDPILTIILIFYFFFYFFFLVVIFNTVLVFLIMYVTLFH